MQQSTLIVNLFQSVPAAIHIFGFVLLCFFHLVTLLFLARRRRQRRRRQQDFTCSNSRRCTILSYILVFFGLLHGKCNTNIFSSMPCESSRIRLHFFLIVSYLCIYLFIYLSLIHWRRDAALYAFELWLAKKNICAIKNYWCIHWCKPCFCIYTHTVKRYKKERQKPSNAINTITNWTNGPTVEWMSERPIVAIIKSPGMQNS